MVYVIVAAKKDLETAKMVGVEANGKEICVVNVGNEYYAIGNVCTHMRCMLSDGELAGENIRCNCHGSVFSIKTENVVSGPAKKPEPTYKVRIKGNQIMVDV